MKNMKNEINNVSLKFMFIALFAIAFNFNTMAGNSLFESNSQNKGNTNSGQLFDNSASDSKMWGSSESTMFNNTANSGSRQLGPVLPDEPGDTCVPVPDGIWLLIGFVLMYSLRIVFSGLMKNKSKVIIENVVN